jgi:hypothetical protein
MHTVRSGLALAVIFLACLFAAGQDSATSPNQSDLDTKTGPATTPVPAPSTAPTPVQGLPSAAPTLNDVIDRVVQREHYFMAQMRHMHPLVETYLQDLKNDANGNASPVKDQYFLGRLDMSDGPEDVSFVGQPGFGHRMLSKLTGVYSLHYLPMGFAQMVVKALLQIQFCSS